MEQLPRYIGETVRVSAHGRTGSVRKVRAGVFVFSIDGFNNRTRWGNAEEMREDLATFNMTGGFPGLKSGQFAGL